MKNDLTLEQVSSVLRYDPDTGFLFWTHARQHSLLGKRAGSTTKQGYIEVKLFGRKRFAHRLAWLLHHGRWPDGLIDHINREKSDNRIENLRVVSVQQNSWNRPPADDSMSGFRGVEWDKHKRRWVVRLGYKNRNLNLGRYQIFEDAVAARIEGEKKYYGEYAPQFT